MEHEEAVELVALYAIGALPADERQDVQSHLRTCVACCWEALVYAESAAALARDVFRELRPPAPE